MEEEQSDGGLCGTGERAQLPSSPWYGPSMAPAHRLFSLAHRTDRPLLLCRQRVAYMEEEMYVGQARLDLDSRLAEQPVESASA